MMEKYVLLGELFRRIPKIQGRKKLQKIVYICQQLGVPFQEGFHFHHYGPYSHALALEIEEMRALGLLQERDSKTGCDYPTYEYELTVAGKKHLTSGSHAYDLSSYEKLLATLNSRTPRELELISTVFYLQAMDYEDGELADKVQQLKGEQGYTRGEIEDAIQAANLMRKSLKQVHCKG